MPGRVGYPEGQWTVKSRSGKSWQGEGQMWVKTRTSKRQKERVKAHMNIQGNALGGG